jgi:amidohydrolase
MSNTQPFNVVELREEFHKIPELGFQEKKTSELIVSKLKELGLSPITGIGGTGVAAYIDGTEPGPTVMLRADMDALPFVQDGKPCTIHACGHDCHVSVILAVASRLIGKIRKGRVKLFFQPAEETLLGALRSVEDGVVDDVDIALGCHVRPIQDIPDGTVCASINHTSSTFMRIKLQGLTAHAARPHLGKSAVEAAVLITNALNSLWMNPLKGWSAKVTAIRAEAAAANIIPDQGEMMLDIRAESNDLMKEFLEKIEKTVVAAADAVGVTATVEYPGGVIPAPNYDKELTAQVEETIKEVLGADRLAPSCGAGGEDFHYFSAKKPSLKNAYIGIGTGAHPGLHHPQMTLNPNSLENGVKVLVAQTLKILG